jgi:hypothetical protein
VDCSPSARGLVVADDLSIRRLSRNVLDQAPYTPTERADQNVSARYFRGGIDAVRACYLRWQEKLAGQILWLDRYGTNRLDDAETGANSPGEMHAREVKRGSKSIGLRLRDCGPRQACRMVISCPCPEWRADAVTPCRDHVQRPPGTFWRWPRSRPSPLAPFTYWSAKWRRPPQSIAQVVAEKIASCVGAAIATLEQEPSVRLLHNSVEAVAGGQGCSRWTQAARQSRQTSRTQLTR